MLHQRRGLTHGELPTEKGGGGNKGEIVELSSTHHALPPFRASNPPIPMAAVRRENDFYYFLQEWEVIVPVRI